MVVISKIPKAFRRQNVGDNGHLQTFLRWCPDKSTIRDFHFLTLALNDDVRKCVFMWFLAKNT